MKLAPALPGRYRGRMRFLPLVAIFISSSARAENWNWIEPIIVLLFVIAFLGANVLVAVILGLDVKGRPLASPPVAKALYYFIQLICLVYVWAFFSDRSGPFFYMGPVALLFHAWYRRRRNFY